MCIEMETADQFRERRVFGRHFQARAQRTQRHDAGMFVADMARQLVLRRQRLAQIVGQRAPADQIVARCKSRGHVEHQFDVRAGVDFRMILDALRHTVQRVDFGEHDAQRVACAQ